MKYEDIKFFSQRCEEHPDHQSGMVSHGMIAQRLQEEIDELRDYIEFVLDERADAFLKDLREIRQQVDKRMGKKLCQEVMKEKNA